MDTALNVMALIFYTAASIFTVLMVIGAVLNRRDRAGGTVRLAKGDISVEVRGYGGARNEEIARETITRWENRPAAPPTKVRVHRMDDQ